MRNKTNRPILRLYVTDNNTREEPLGVATARAAEALGELAVRLPASDVLREPAGALALCLSERLGALRERPVAQPSP